jgi:UDP-GlcNAc:undecaprenyl-phosphate/decaprenyl-phosphate GlcNAc-1-phosphate transferase
MDMLFAIFRRVVKREPIGAPDRLHFHQLMMRGLGLTYFDRTQRNVSNPLAAALVLPMTAVPIIAAQFYGTTLVKVRLLCCSLVRCSS